MKKSSALIACIFGICINSFCQKVPVNEPDYNKPKLFRELPRTIPVSAGTLNSLFDLRPGELVNVNLSDASLFQFKGEIVSVTGKYGNSIRSIVIRSANYNGARLTVSRITGENGVAVYSGRILSLQYGDLYELQNHNGRYALVKRDLYDLVNE